MVIFNVVPSPNHTRHTQSKSFGAFPISTIESAYLAFGMVMMSLLPLIVNVFTLMVIIRMIDTRSRGKIATLESQSVSV